MVNLDALPRSDSPASSVDVPLRLSLFIGTTIREILYGMELVIFFAAVYCICHRPPDYRKRQRFYIVHGGVLIVLATISVTADALLAKEVWIGASERHYPGGQVESHGPSESDWYNTMGFSADAAANIFGDGLLVYRCYIIWSRQWRIIAIPILIYLASSALAIITVVAGAVPPTTLLNGKLQYGVPWFSLSVSLNIIITSIICFRLLQMRALMRETHSLNMSKMYASIAAMLVESAAVFSILGIVLIVMAVRNDPLTFAFAHVWSMFSSLSPQMIILRVSMGSSWHEETVNEISTTFVPARPATFPEGSQGVCMTTSSTCSSEDPVYGPRTPLVDSSDMLTKEHMGTGDVAC